MKDNIEIGLNHKIYVDARKNINIAGVKKIVTFDDEEFLVETNMGQLLIKGSNLEMSKFDTKEEIVNIHGKINSLNYIEGRNKDNNILSKLFK